jgi:uncharacterized membrane protein YdjX (TVP38/TMEM64 family)
MTTSYARAALAAAILAAAALAVVLPHDAHALLALVAREAAKPYAPLVVMAVFVGAGAVLVPVTLLIAGTTLVFGPWHGALYALIGATLSGVLAWAAGRHFGMRLLDRWSGPRMERVRAQVNARGLLAVILIRVVPSGPYTLMNLAAGACGVRLRDFALGTMIGLLPGIAAAAGLTQILVALFA